MKFVMVVVILLLIGAFFIVSNENLHLRNGDEMGKFMSLYYNWFVELSGNAKTITSYVIDIDWMPKQNNSVG